MAERTSRVLPIVANVIIPAIVTAVVAAAGFAVWVANRKRIAAETIGRAEENALRIARDAERDTETRRKEALLEAKEKAHELLIEAERQASQTRHDPPRARQLV